MARFIRTVAISKSKKIAHELLDYFVETGNHECFVALLYTSYEFIANDYVMELSWLHNLSNFIKPYEISIAFENQKKLNKYTKIYKEKADRKQEEEPGVGQPLMLTNGPMSYQGTGATGIGYQPTGTGFGNAF